MKTLLTRWILLAAVILGTGGCGAFADALDRDAGQPDAGSTLAFSPNAAIRQGELKEFEISFVVFPPWAGQSGVTGAVTTANFGEGITISKVNYDLDLIVEATLKGDTEAEPGPRLVNITVVGQVKGGPQQSHSGWGFLFVYPRFPEDGGTDGGGDS